MPDEIFVDRVFRTKKRAAPMDPEIRKLTDNEKALIQAVLQGDAAKTRELLSAGTDVNVRNADSHPLGLELNTTPLMCATSSVPGPRVPSGAQ